VATGDCPDRRNAYAQASKEKLPSPTELALQNDTLKLN